MRKLPVVVGVVGVIAALSVALAAPALADTEPTPPAGGAEISSTPVESTAPSTPATPAPSTDPAPTCTVDHNPRVPGCQNSGPIAGGPREHHNGGPAGHWRPGLPWGGPTIYGHQLWLDANLSLDVCSAADYSGFLNRNAVHRDRVLKLLGASPAQRWAALHQGCGPVVQLPAGLSLVNGHYLRLGAGFDDADVCGYTDYRVFSDRYGHRYGDRFNDRVRAHFGHDPVSMYRTLRVKASCPAVTNTVVVEGASASQTPATVSSSATSGTDTVTSPPAGNYSQVSNPPVGAPEAGSL